MRSHPSSCQGCVLFNMGRGFLSSEGTGSNGVCIVGESAGSHEARASLPFRPSAPSGGFLEELFDMCGYKRQDFTITNLCLCQPLGNDLDLYPSAIAHCRQYLDALIEKTQPKILLALGKLPLQALTDTKLGISEARGFVLESRYGIPCISSYHPSYLVRGAAGTLKGVAIHDLRTAVRFAQKGVPLPLETNYDLHGRHVAEYIRYLRSDPSIPVALDVETAHILGQEEGEKPNERRLVHIQFSSSPGSAFVLPWEGWGIEAAKEILSLPNMKLTWNGRLFDYPVLKAYGIPIEGELHDAMLMWAHLQPGFMSSKDDNDGDKGVPAKLMGLQSCLSFYYPQEMMWKGILEKVKASGYDFNLALKFYGAVDSDMTLRLGVKLIKTLKDGGLW